MFKRVVTTIALWTFLSKISVQARIRMGRDIAKKGASVAGKVSQKAADISIRVAESIVRRVGPSAGFGRQLNAGGQSRADAAQEIAAASLVAAVEIYASMEEAARTVVKSSGQATADLVGHRCGMKPNAGPIVLHGRITLQVYRDWVLASSAASLSALHARCIEVVQSPLFVMRNLVCELVMYFFDAVDASVLLSGMEQTLEK